MAHKMLFDKAVVFTDNETWCGRVHPTEALKRYRQLYVPTAKLVVCATTATEFTIADPNDPGMLDLCGFDSSCPQLISAF